MNMIEGYKVFLYKNKAYYSCSTDVKGLRIRYRTNKINYPKVGKIFIFNTLANAEDFKRFLHSERFKIFKCVCYDVKLLKKKILYSTDLTVKNVEEFFNHSMMEDPSIKTSSVPTGTFCCSSLEMLEEIR